MLLIFVRTIDRIKWGRAKTYEESAPHEYIVKGYFSLEGRKIFLELADYIRKYGYKEKFYKTTYIYFVLDDKKYRLMCKNESQDQIINKSDKELIYK